MNGEGSKGCLAGVGGTIGKMCRWGIWLSDESESRRDSGDDRRGVTDARCGFGVFGNSVSLLSSEKLVCSSELPVEADIESDFSASAMRSVPFAIRSFHSGAQLDRFIALAVRFGTVVKRSSSGIPPRDRWTVCLRSSLNRAGLEEVPMGNERGMSGLEAFHDSRLRVLMFS